MGDRLTRKRSTNEAQRTLVALCLRPAGVVHAYEIHAYVFGLGRSPEQVIESLRHLTTLGLVDELPNGEWRATQTGWQMVNGSRTRAP